MGKGDETPLTTNYMETQGNQTLRFINVEPLLARGADPLPACRCA
jgi:hypothetical protein